MINKPKWTFDLKVVQDFEDQDFSVTTNFETIKTLTIRYGDTVVFEGKLESFTLYSSGSRTIVDFMRWLEQAQEEGIGG